MRFFAVIVWILSLLPLGERCAFAQDVTRLGGDLTTELTGKSAIQVTAPNVTDETRRLQQLAGFSTFHDLFKKRSGLGPQFINASCSGCHVDNGRGPTEFSHINLGQSTMVVKVSLPGLKPSGAPRDVPGVGEQLLDQYLEGQPNVDINLQWVNVDGQYPDGTPYRLRKPNLRFRIDGKSGRPIISSLRMTPPVIGPGLLEAIPDSEILALSDPGDLDRDGISGKPNFVIDKRTGQYAIGRFGFKASNTTVEQQSAAALFHDMGITNPVISDVGIPIELPQETLDILVLYQKLAGVPKAIRQDDPRVIAGKSLFQQIGCHLCHRMTMKTGDYPDPELANQEFHPFTDLLLHNMGPGLADKRAEFSAAGAEWRTTPLWGLGFSRTLARRKAVFLHDGRAKTIEQAILWHGGEARASQRRFQALSKEQRTQLIAFLNSL